VSSFVRKFRNDFFICHSSYFFFFKTWQNQLTFIRSQGRNEGAQFPGRQITMGALNHYGERRMTAGASKSPNNVTSSLFSSIQYIGFQKTSNSKMGRQTCFLPRALSNLVTSLYDRVPCTCYKVWVSSPHWRSLLRMWLSKLLQLSPRSAASIWWEKLLYTSKTISKLVQIHTDVFIQKHIRKLWWDNSFHNSSVSVEKIFTDTFGSWID